MLPIEGQEDRIYCKSSAGGDFNVHDGWECIEKNKPRVIWFKLLWSSHLIPKHCFMAWLTILDRLSTKDRQINWGRQIDPTCVLCSNHLETRNHLFFYCNFSKCVWRKILSVPAINRRVGDWNMEFDWAVQNLQEKSLKSTILRLAWCASIYYIWRERNNRIHSNVFKSPDFVAGKVAADVTVKLSVVVGHVLNAQMRDLCQKWNIL